MLRLAGYFPLWGIVAVALVLHDWVPPLHGLWYALAVGCAATRVVSGARFKSEVLLAALVGYVSVSILWPRSGLAGTQSPAGCA
jgi:hypothetical protein